MKTDIIILAHNKENNINSCYEKLLIELKGLKYKIILVDNGSTDNTFEELKKIQMKDEDNIKVISLSKKYNDNNAIVAALNYSQGDYACVYDFTYSTNYIKKLIMCINEEGYDSICLCKKMKEPNIFQKMWTNILKKLLKADVINDKTNCRIFNKKMIKAIINFSKENIICNDTFDKLGFNVYYEKIKTNAVNKYEIEIPNNLKSILICMLLGISLIIVSFIFLITTIISTKITFTIILIFLLLLLSGVNLAYTAILNRNVIININRSEPNYIIKDKYGFDEDML